MTLQIGALIGGTVDITNRQSGYKMMGEGRSLYDNMEFNANAASLTHLQWGNLYGSRC